MCRKEISHLCFLLSASFVLFASLHVTRLQTDSNICRYEILPDFTYIAVPSIKHIWFSFKIIACTCLPHLGEHFTLIKVYTLIKILSWKSEHNSTSIYLHIYFFFKFRMRKKLYIFLYLFTFWSLSIFSQAYRLGVDETKFWSRWMLDAIPISSD